MQLLPRLGVPRTSLSRSYVAFILYIFFFFFFFFSLPDLLPARSVRFLAPARCCARSVDRLRHDRRTVGRGVTVTRFTIFSAEHDELRHSRLTSLTFHFGRDGEPRAGQLW